MNIHSPLRYIVLSAIVVLFAAHAQAAQPNVVVLAAAAAEKPKLWIYTDLSDPRDQRTGGHPQTDPDDICSLAALLLEANRFHIEAVVFLSTNREGLADATDFVQSTFAAAYAHDLPYLNRALGGFEPEIRFLDSSITRDGRIVQFDPRRDYTVLEGLETVAALVDYAEHNPVYVLNWGALTESAMAVKHCLDTGNLRALENMTFISHWSMSWIAQGSPQDPYKVANCRDDGAACDFMHRIAGGHPAVKFIELGSVGQTGIVNGSAGYERFDSFRRSRLGQIFIHAKFYHGRPDQSDGSTFWLATEAFGPTLADYRHDGTLDQPTEERVRDLFLENGHAILDDLLERSNAAALANDPFPPEFIVDRFTYVYRYLNGRYYIYVPLEARYEMRDRSGRAMMEGDLACGNHELDLAEVVPGRYEVTVHCGGVERVFSLEKPAQ